MKSLTPNFRVFFLPTCDLPASLDVTVRCLKVYPCVYPHPHSNDTLEFLKVLPFSSSLLSLFTSASSVSAHVTSSAKPCCCVHPRLPPCSCCRCSASQDFCVFLCNSGRQLLDIPCFLTFKSNPTYTPSKELNNRPRSSFRSATWLLTPTGTGDRSFGEPVSRKLHCQPI